jgi:peptidoglycan-associated lipoprotein
MTKRFWRQFALVLVIPGLMFVASCGKDQVKPSDAEIEAGQQRSDAERDELARRVGPKHLEDASVREEYLRQEAKKRRERQMFADESIHFDFDRSSLTPKAQEILRRKAAWLKANPEVSAVLIEGHCDERGTNEYNMALGDRRANSAKNFLVDMGVSAARLSTISLGEERPVDPRSKEEAWAKNRRADFSLN